MGFSQRVRRAPQRADARTCCQRVVNKMDYMSGWYHSFTFVLKEERMFP